MIDIIACIGIVILLLVILLNRLYSIKMQKEQELVIKDLKETKTRLQLYISKIDGLMSALSSIHEFSVYSSGVIQREELTQHIVDLACKLFDAGIGSVMLMNSETNNLEIVASKGLPSEVVSSTKMKIGEGIAGKVVSTGRPIFVADVSTDPRFINFSHNYYPSKSFISVPMEVRGRVIGVLNLTSDKKSDVFEDQAMNLLSILADQSAVALENLSLYDNLQKFYLEMVETLSKTIDAKDKYTYDHVTRARKSARDICKQLSLPESITKHVEYAALVHDIGKIGIDNHILEKPGKLSQEERKFVEKHPEIGARILEPVAFLSPVSPMVLYHQEWYNGKGYPEGLVGQEIPLGARIVAVIDAYDAMTSDRPYRKALPEKKAIVELKNGKGIQFDPEIVTVFLQTLDKE